MEAGSCVTAFPASDRDITDSRDAAKGGCYVECRYKFIYIAVLCIHILSLCRAPVRGLCKVPEVWRQGGKVL